MWNVHGLVLEHLGLALGSLCEPDAAACLALANDI